MPTLPLDATDLRLLDILRQNSRLSNKEIASRLHKSETPTLRRLRRLEERGIIEGYSVVLNLEKIGRSLVAFTHIQLRDHSRESLTFFENEIVKLPEVLECYQVSGQYDLVLRVAVRDLKTYHDFLMNKVFEAIPMAHIQSVFVMKEAKRQSAMPLL